MLFAFLNWASSLLIRSAWASPAWQAPDISATIYSRSSIWGEEPEPLTPASGSPADEAAWGKSVEPPALSLIRSSGGTMPASFSTSPSPSSPDEESTYATTPGILG
ncbi:hypothetical protein LWI29_023224 [Acer saccharum]|uniref:Uncharacterized protein n=1 Tax=Acer saccharum TaxID=4024 RepID=A0AA39VXS3_ACESA|nr:hypothetical protein LWI29_023224 [Acer saccharum]